VTQSGPLVVEQMTSQLAQLMVDSMTARLKTNPNYHPSTTMFDSCCVVFVLKCCVWFSPNMAITPKSLVVCSDAAYKLNASQTLDNFGNN